MGTPFLWNSVPISGLPLSQLITTTIITRLLSLPGVLHLLLLSLILFLSLCNGPTEDQSPHLLFATVLRHKLLHERNILLN